MAQDHSGCSGKINIHNYSLVPWEQAQPQAASLLHQSHMQLHAYISASTLSKSWWWDGYKTNTSNKSRVISIWTMTKSVHTSLQFSKYVLYWMVGKSESLYRLYLWKKGFILQSKGAHFEKIRGKLFPPHFTWYSMASTLQICFLRLWLWRQQLVHGTCQNEW